MYLIDVYIEYNLFFFVEKMFYFVVVNNVFICMLCFFLVFYCGKIFFFGKIFEIKMLDGIKEMMYWIYDKFLFVDVIGFYCYFGWIS